jgi:NitT/TauT family transport system substrate-binding protein
MFKTAISRKASFFIFGMVILTLGIIPPVIARVEFGKPGDPIHLVVGYQPYYTGAWSGVVNQGKQFWKKYLPAGSTVEFQAAGQGSVIVKTMTEEKQHLGYVGDTPAIDATFRYLKPRGGVDIRIVAVLGTSQQMCNNLLIRNDAPSFKNGREAVLWLNNKIISTAYNSCSHRFARFAFKESGINPKEYLNQNLELLATNFSQGKIDAAVLWEPNASKLVKTGLAKRAATGKDFNALDGGFLIMLNDLIEQRPDVHKAWLQAELDAQLFMADPVHAEEVIELVKQQTEGFDKEVLWEALYGSNSSDQTDDVRLQFDFTVTDRVQKLLDDATVFLNSMPRKIAAEPKLRAGGVMDEVARQILKERGLASPVGVIKASKSGVVLK